MVVVVVFGVSAARAVGVPVRVGVGGGVDFDVDVDEGVDFDVKEGGDEEVEDEEVEVGLVVVGFVVSRESTVGIEDRDRDGEDITEGRMVAFATTAGRVDMVCIVVDGSCAYICVLPLYAAAGQKHWHWQAAFPEPAPPPLPAVADGRTVVRAVAVFVPVAAGGAVEETVPLILIAVSLNI